MLLSRREALVLAFSSIIDFPDITIAVPVQPQPDRAFPTRDDRLAADMTIYRDSYGVPHIVGDTEEAAFFGYGYAQAEDHLERMMLQYRDAQGRLAEVQGSKALGGRSLRFDPSEYRWGGDYLQRLMRTKQGVIDNRDKIDPAVHSLLDAFARGVNSYIGEHRSELPGWMDGITAEDLEAFERSNYFRFYSVHDALAKMADQEWNLPAFGSNQWAVMPGKSADGRIMHVEHTHMPWANHLQNYEAHLMVPGRLNAGGISWLGSPFFLMGFNDRITWSATWNQPNISDVYVEWINPRNHRQYLYEGGWREIRQEMATFRVEHTQGTQTVSLPLYYTHHGPVVKFDAEHHLAWSVKVPNFDGVNYSLGLYSLMKAQNLDEFKAALARQLIPRWNFLFSDSRDIYWVHNGDVPERNNKFNWLKPVPGWTHETEWGPPIPFDRYPQLANPASGFLQNCNNPFWVSTSHSGLDPLMLGPYYLQHPVKPGAGMEALNTRGERVIYELGKDRKFTRDEMVELAYDTYILPATVIVPLLMEASQSRMKGERLRRPLEELKNWNRRSAEGSLATTYLYYWAKSYKSAQGEAKYARFVSYDRGKIDIHSSREQDAAWDAFVNGMEMLGRKFGTFDVPWGKINVVVRDGVFPMDGASVELFGVLHPDEGPEQADGRILCDGAWGHMMIVVEADAEHTKPKEIWTLLPFGESEHRNSPHYNDLAKLHSRHMVKPFWFSPEQILAHSESVRGHKNRIRRMCARS
jgi:acyl-homoserine lactone acylase PvdQ